MTPGCAGIHFQPEVSLLLLIVLKQRVAAAAADQRI